MTPALNLRFRIRLALVIGLVVAGLAGASACGAGYVRTALPPPADQLPASSITRHVIVVSVDGLRPDAIAKFGATTLQRLIQEGSYTLSARTIDPSKTLPSHTPTSMLTGLGPDQHHVLWNNVATAKAETIDLPNIFSVARSHGYRTAAFFSKAKFQPLQLDGTLDYSQAPGGLFGKWSAARTIDDVAVYFETSKPNLLFVHLPDPDSSGHSSGWMSRAYGRAVLAADAAIGRLLDLADRTFGADRYSIIVTADHGGHGHGHGSADSQDVTIPWIAWGRGREAGRIVVAGDPDDGHGVDGPVAAGRAVSVRLGRVGRRRGLPPGGGGISQPRLSRGPR